MTLHRLIWHQIMSSGRARTGGTQRWGKRTCRKRSRSRWWWSGSCPCGRKRCRLLSSRGSGCWWRRTGILSGLSSSTWTASPRQLSPHSTSRLLSRLCTNWIRTCGRSGVLAPGILCRDTTSEIRRRLARPSTGLRRRQKVPLSVFRQRCPRPPVR